MASEPSKTPTRLPDWERRLQALIGRSERRAFAWGAFDCCTFAADAVLAQTGADLLGELRGTWDTQVGALRVVRGLTAAGFGAAMARVVLDAGLEEIPLPKAMRGDLVLVHSGEARWTRAAAIVQGTHAVGPTAGTGLVSVARERWVRAWHVPFGGEGSAQAGGAG